MDLEKVLAQLRGELQNVDDAILSLERLQQVTRRRGRPPLLMTEEKDTALPRRGRKPRGGENGRKGS